MLSSPWKRTLVMLSGATLGGLTLLGACVVEAEDPEPVCGDGDADADEECDGDDFAGGSCLTAGFEHGEVTCTKSCTLETSACVILDEDQDELNIYDEGFYGTDPLNPDSDGDGITDGAEINNGSDPLNWASWPGHIGAWPNHLADSIESGIAPEGWEIGDVVFDEVWTDQFGQEVHMHQFYGYVTVIALAAVWCGPCNLAAQTSQELMDKHQLQGVVFIEQLIDGNNFGTTAVMDDAVGWATQYGLRYPVVFSTDPLTAPAVPTYFVMDRDLRITAKYEGYPGDSALSFSISNALAASDE